MILIISFLQIDFEIKASAKKLASNQNRVAHKDHKSADVVRKQVADFSRKINTDISPVYTSKKIKDEIKDVREDKPPLVSQQCVVYSFQCGLCGAGYVGYTCRHLHQRIKGHKGSAIGNHLRAARHGARRHHTEFSNLMKVSEQI